MWTDEQIQELVCDQRAGIGGCPPAETLTRAVSGSLARDEAEAVADHLAECGHCAEDAQALRPLESWAGRAALEGASPGRRTREIATRRWTSHPLLKVAAVLAAATIALSAALLHARSQGREAQAALQAQIDATARTEGRLRAELARALGADSPAPPAPESPPHALANVAIVDLPRGGGAGGGLPAAVPAGAPLAVGVLRVPGDTPPYADYAVEVWHGARLRFRGAGFVRRRDDSFTIALPAGLLARGESSVRLFGLHAGRRTLVADYALRVSG